MKLQDKLNHLNSYPFHMPGHKRNKKFGIPGAEFDITEIDGFDNLHAADGVLLDIENKLSKIYKSKKTFMLINGSTVGILSAICAVCKEGDKIIVARNCHKSVYNACLLNRLQVVYAEPEFDNINGFYKGISQQTLNVLLAQHRDAKAVVITSPTYEGFVSRIKADIPLIIDAAHGAHFGLADFPEYPQADIVVSSLHKTLPALTQTAVLNVYNQTFLPKVKFYLDIFETSSPSYILMNSAEICADYVLENQNAFEKYCSMLVQFRGIALEKLQLVNTDDLSKIVVSTAYSDISGADLSQVLREDYHIEAEMFSKNYVLFMTSVADDKNAFEHLEYALSAIDKNLCSAQGNMISKPPVLSGNHLISVSDKTSETDLNHSVGKISNEFVYAYPPDIPILVPNEPITKEVVAYLVQMHNSGVHIVSDSAQFPNKLLTKAD